MHISTLQRFPHCQTSIQPDIHTTKFSHFQNFTLLYFHTGMLTFAMLDFNTARFLQYPTSTSSTISALPHCHTTRLSSSKTSKIGQTSTLTDFRHTVRVYHTRFPHSQQPCSFIPSLNDVVQSMLNSILSV